MYTLSFWRSHLGIVAVDQSHQEYPRVILDLRAIKKLAGYVSPGFRAESVQNPPGICPANKDSCRNPHRICAIILNGEFSCPINI